MKRVVFLMAVSMALVLVSCDESQKQNADKELKKQTEIIMQESNRQVGMPAIINFQEKKNLKWIYELCDQEDLICYAYLFNEMQGTIGQYLGECIGYGIPYSTQFSNPEKTARSYTQGGFEILPQAEPNGLFKPEGLSATWLIMLDPETKKLRPVYIEPQIIVSPFKLK